MIPAKLVLFLEENGFTKNTEFTRFGDDLFSKEISDTKVLAFTIYDGGKFLILRKTESGFVNYTFMLSALIKNPDTSDSLKVDALIRAVNTIIGNIDDINTIIDMMIIEKHIEHSQKFFLEKHIPCEEGNHIFFFTSYFYMLDSNIDASLDLILSKDKAIACVIGAGNSGISPEQMGVFLKEMVNS